MKAREIQKARSTLLIVSSALSTILLLCLFRYPFDEVCRKKIYSSRSSLSARKLKVIYIAGSNDLKPVGKIRKTQLKVWGI